MVLRVASRPRGGGNRPSGPGAGRWVPYRVSATWRSGGPGPGVRPATGSRCCTRSGQRAAGALHGDGHSRSSSRTWALLRGVRNAGSWSRCWERPQRPGMTRRRGWLAEGLRQPAQPSSLRLPKTHSTVGLGGGKLRPPPCRSPFRKEQGDMRYVAGWGVLAQERLLAATGFPCGVVKKLWNEWKKKKKSSGMRERRHTTMNRPGALENA